MHGRTGNPQPSAAAPGSAGALHESASRTDTPRTNVLQLEEILKETEHPRWLAARLLRLRQSASELAGTPDPVQDNPDDGPALKVELLWPDLPDTPDEAPTEMELQNQLFRILVEEAPQIIWHADPQGGLLYANPRWYALTGTSPADCLGRKWLDRIHPQDREDQLDNWQRCRVARQPYTGARRIRTSDGGYQAMSCKATPMLGDDGEVAFWVGMDTDITEIKAAEDALRQSNEELSAFSYSVSHDLRSPLNAIDGFSRLLGRHLGPQASEKARHYLSRIDAGISQMGRLIEDLLSLAQVSRTEFRHEAIDLSQLAAQIMERYLAATAGRQVTVQITPGLRAQGDERLVRVALDNLLGNAWKFSSRTAHAEIVVGQLQDAEGEPIFFVRDNGAGFDMAYVDKLFKTCQRLHSQSDFAGTGVGLATVHRIVTRHGGEVWADSEEGQGATFYFTLPD